MGLQDGMDRPATRPGGFVTGRGEDLTPDWHWYDSVFGIPLGMLGFYDPGRTAD
jgi:hypothetical protein